MEFFSQRCFVNAAKLGFVRERLEFATLLVRCLQKNHILVSTRTWHTHTCVCPTTHTHMVFPVAAPDGLDKSSGEWSGILSDTSLASSPKDAWSTLLRSCVHTSVCSCVSSCLSWVGRSACVRHAPCVLSRLCMCTFMRARIL